MAQTADPLGRRVRIAVEAGDAYQLAAMIGGKEALARTVEPVGARGPVGNKAAHEAKAVSLSFQNERLNRRAERCQGLDVQVQARGAPIAANARTWSMNARSAGAIWRCSG